jgi:hypothetical protein
VVCWGPSRCRWWLRRRRERTCERSWTRTALESKPQTNALLANVIIFFNSAKKCTYYCQFWLQTRQFRHSRYVYI